MTLTTFDDEGRTIETIQNYSTTIATATNITTNYAFNAGTALLSATSVTTENADLSGTQTQITAYVYGTGTDRFQPCDLPQRSGLRRGFRAIPASQFVGLVHDIEDGLHTSGLNVVEYAV